MGLLVTNSVDFLPTGNVLVFITVGYRIPGYMVHFFQHSGNIFLPVSSENCAVVLCSSFLVSSWGLAPVPQA